MHPVGPRVGQRERVTVQLQIPEQLRQHRPGRRAFLFGRHSIGVLHIAHGGSNLKQARSPVGKRKLVQIAFDLEAHRPEFAATQGITQVVARVAVYGAGQVARQARELQAREFALQRQLAQAGCGAGLGGCGLARFRPDQGHVPGPVGIGNLQARHLQAQAAIHPTPAQVGGRLIQRDLAVIQHQGQRQHAFFDRPVRCAAGMAGVDGGVQPLHAQAGKTGAGVGCEAEFLDLRFQAVFRGRAPRALPLHRQVPHLSPSL